MFAQSTAEVNILPPQGAKTIGIVGGSGIVPRRQARLRAWAGIEKVLTRVAHGPVPGPQTRRRRPHG
jgi:hypothetical protein